MRKFTKKNVLVNPDYLSIKSFIEDIPNNFDDLGVTIFDGRNQIKDVSIDGYRIIIKSYKRITVANRFIYATFRKSKAQRAYENAFKLFELDITTPQPVAYVNCFNGLFLSQSYFVSLFVEHLPISTVLLDFENESHDILNSFAKFSHSIHQKGVLHRDFNLNNVLLKRTSGKYEFCVIDINRMNFRRLNKNQALSSLRRIHFPLEQHAVFAAEYARLAKQEPHETFMKMIFYRHLYEVSGKAKRLFKSFIKRIEVSFPLRKKTEPGLD